MAQDMDIHAQMFKTAISDTEMTDEIKAAQDHIVRCEVCSPRLKRLMEVLLGAEGPFPSEKSEVEEEYPRGSQTVFTDEDADERVREHIRSTVRRELAELMIQNLAEPLRWADDLGRPYWTFTTSNLEGEGWSIIVDFDGHVQGSWETPTLGEDG